MMKALSILLCVFFSLVSTAFAVEDTKKVSEDAIIDATIELARSYLGGSEKLDAIKSLHYKGTMLYSDGNSGVADIVFKKPSFQRFTADINTYRETSGLDDTEAWHFVENLANPADKTLRLYGVEEILNMQASVWEYLNFYKRPEGRGQDVVYEGRQHFGNIECVVLTYDHGDGIWFRRFFEVTSGRLMQTLSNRGALFIEEGEIIVDGIRFPKKLTTRFLNLRDASSIEMVYSKIEVNKAFDNSIFKLPKED